MGPFHWREVYARAVPQIPTTKSEIGETGFGIEAEGSAASSKGDEEAAKGGGKRAAETRATTAACRGSAKVSGRAGETRTRKERDVTARAVYAKTTNATAARRHQTRANEAAEDSAKTAGREATATTTTTP